LGQDCYYQIVRQNFMPLSLAGAPREADIAQHAFETMGERLGGLAVQEHPRMLQKDPRVL
jgi:hypothetical protein